MIFLIRNPNNVERWIPIDCDPQRVQGGVIPTGLKIGMGISHFETCTDPDKHSRKSPSNKRPPAFNRKSEQGTLDIGEQKPPVCIICGCTEGSRCSIDRAELSHGEQDVHVGRLNLIGPNELPSSVSCYFASITPPICSAPSCQAKKADLPLAMRLGRNA